MRHFDALLLDLDNTLYSYEDAHEAALHSLFAMLQEKMGLDEHLAESSFNNARARVHSQLQGTAASHNRLLYFQHLCEQLDLTPANHVLALYNSYWDTFLDKMTLFPNVKDFLDQWIALGKRVCLVTDLTAHIQFRKLTTLGLENYFHKVITSEEIGHEKPHPSMFLMALEKLQLGKKQVAMIGDHFEKDILGARQLGIEAYWFAPNYAEREGEQSVNFDYLLEMIK